MTLAVSRPAIGSRSTMVGRSYSTLPPFFPRPQ
jgi:hypothetical protein